MQIKKNNHFEGINRVFEWTEGGILKTIAVEYTYSEKPTFEISMMAFARIGWLLHRYGGVLRHIVPLWQWYSQLAVVELPRDKQKLPGLLEDAYRDICSIGTASLRKT